MRLARNSAGDTVGILHVGRLKIVWVALTGYWKDKGIRTTTVDVLPFWEMINE